ncbi:MAG: hypothetical protein A3H33_09260 [Betaproteobacteria bacterium RIFCSPLOWO2_02_FULL_65_20]|nr:MAG: hypothetical protein A3H33_09260 [Betaproteobacteria bacterium RIFCSPLOWO2_02_FULL_65_20]
MARRQRGYILIYALTILLFLVGTVTGAAYALRLNAQEAYQQRERLRAEFRLRGALQYALAQFALAAQAPSAAGTPSNAGQPDETEAAWRLEASAQQLQIDGTQIAIAIDDPGGIADANALDERMWTDYFAALGVARPGEAQRWAAAVIAWKARVGKTNGRGGFAGIDDLLLLDALPATVRYGGWAAAERPDTAQDTAPGFPDLFLVGAGERVFDVNRAALPLIAAATGASTEQLDAYRAARERGKLTLSDAVRLLGERARPLLQESRTDPVFRLVLTTAAGGASRLGLAAFVQRRDGQVRVLASRLNPVAAANPEP